MSLKAFYDTHWRKIWATAILVPILVLLVGYALLPELFWDEFIWRYYWGPIVEDKEYNVVDTLTYGIILALSLFGIYKLLKKLDIETGTGFFIALTPYIFLGGVLRALEDSELFKVPFKYLFISPIIYFILGLTTIGILLIGVFLERLYVKSRRVAFILLAIAFAILNIIYTLFFLYREPYLNFALSPLLPILISVGILATIFFYSKFKSIDVFTVLFSFGLLFLLLFFSYIVYWTAVGRWVDIDVKIHLEAMPLVIGLTVLSTLLTFIAFRFISRWRSEALVFTAGVNIALFLGHFMDASATFIGIDYYGYTEKHILPSFLIGIFHTAGIMYLLKLVVISLVIYLIDISYKDDLRDDKVLIGLVKLCIFILGLAPGTRDMLRLTMGV